MTPLRNKDVYSIAGNKRAVTPRCRHLGSWMVRPTMDPTAWAWATSDDDSAGFAGFAAFATCVREEGK